MSKKLVLFGAGKIGRSFIGQLFGTAGYQVIFVDVNDRLIEALNREHTYQVIIKSDEQEQKIIVPDVRGISANNAAEVAAALAQADLAAVSVGHDFLPDVCGLLAGGINERYRQMPGTPLDIILAENMRGAADFVRGELQKHFDQDMDINSYVGLVETSIGKMVPTMPKSILEKDPLTIFAEPFNTLILDKHAFKNDIPDVPGLAPKVCMQAWVDRKLFIHNLGHAAVAYAGYVKNPEATYLWELMSDKTIKTQARQSMVQAAEALVCEYPEVFTMDVLEQHIDDLLHRFANVALGDTVYRVGQDLYRKLGPEDRLAGVLKLAHKHQKPFDKILYVMACALKFEAVDQEGMRSERDIQFTRDAAQGLDYVLEHICQLDPKKYPEIHEMNVDLINATQ